MARRPHRLPFAVLLLALLLGPGPARASTITADITEHLIALTTAFSGTEVTLFGTIQGGGDVVVQVLGPSAQQTVQRKARVAGIWLNNRSVAFAEVPGYYAAAANRPLEEIAPPDVLSRYQLGSQFLRLPVLEANGIEEAEIATFRRALLRNKRVQELYTGDPLPLVFLGPSLFRTNIYFPADVPPGSYLVNAYHFREQRVVGAQSSVLVISKLGVEATLFDLAQQRPTVYALLTILGAITAGYLASLAFRR